MKRFSDTNKWDDPWFMGLSPTAKHLWNYLLDHCDNAGVVEPNTKLASFQIGEPVEEKHFTELGNRLQTLPNGKLWIPKFIKFQYGILKDGSLIHQSVVKLIQSHGLDYPIPFLSHDQAMNMGCSSHKRKDKDKRKEKEPEKKGECEGGGGDPLALPENLKTGEFVAAWQKWMNYRRGLKKPGNWLTLFQEQLKWIGQYTAPRAVEILNQSMRQGWTGLFEPKEDYGNPRKNGGQANRPNPRNVGIIRGPTDYATAKTKFDRERESKEARMAEQVVAHSTNASTA